MMQFIRLLLILVMRLIVVGSIMMGIWVLALSIKSPSLWSVFLIIIVLIVLLGLDLYMGISLIVEFIIQLFRIYGKKKISIYVRPFVSVTITLILIIFLYYVYTNAVERAWYITNKAKELQNRYDLLIKQEETYQLQQKKYYYVKKGDTLWEIAEAQYGNGVEYMVIVSANKISNPEYIEVGSKLILP